MTAEPAGSGALPSGMKWVGKVTAFIGLFGSLGGGSITWLIGHQRQPPRSLALLAHLQHQLRQEGASWVKQRKS
jgi:hypothetical protein